MATIKYPFGSLPVTTVEETSANVYNYEFGQSAIIFLKGTALAADCTLNLTAGSGAKAGNILVIRWLSGAGNAYDVTAKPLIHANGQKFDGTSAKQSSLTLIYNGSIFIPISFIASLDVA